MKVNKIEFNFSEICPEAFEPIRTIYEPFNFKFKSVYEEMLRTCYWCETQMNIMEETHTLITVCCFNKGCPDGNISIIKNKYCE